MKKKLDGHRPCDDEQLCPGNSGKNRGRAGNLLPLQVMSTLNGKTAWDVSHTAAITVKGAQCGHDDFLYCDRRQ